MNKVIIMDKQGNKIREIESAFIPNEGEYIWLDQTIERSDSRKVTGRVVDVVNRSFVITLIVE
ncbi:hypothetical protein [Chryseobacterium sp. WLY505]|uniref:hypothetical protein n=1 Tax=Chryseobacterium sp. WLY505 TaxID=3068892 RepID=UPI002796D069|nr:hypothetical protein [Chryseobacterium sp. WLY505]MDQ1859010.1 hypothetical protein [Chryseobacterium sp. WLY505]